MKEEKCLIVENRNIVNNYYVMQLESQYIAQHSKPGNFVMLAASTSSEPLLKRPFGILDAKSPNIRLYYEIIGKGTELIASLKAGSKVNVVGPLGNVFPTMTGKNILLVAGGRGIAPLFYSIADYTKNNNVYLIYGAKTAEDMNLLEELEEKNLKDIFLYTDNGSKGKQGFVTSNILEIIKDNSIDVTISCGPDAMFEALAHTINDAGTQNYVSMEAMMGCGFGICHSCVVKDVSGNFRKVCTEGPVFKMEDIAWEK
jgi:dihydroorotate dehydrogenase electron transfer subunit